MARFILDVMTEDIQKVLDILDRDEYLASGVSSIRCIDESNDNQFYSHDDYIDRETNKRVVTSPMDNVLSEKQIEEDKNILSKY